MERNWHQYSGQSSENEGKQANRVASAIFFVFCCLLFGGLFGLGRNITFFCAKKKATCVRKLREGLAEIKEFNIEPFTYCKTEGQEGTRWKCPLQSKVALPQSVQLHLQHPDPFPPSPARPLSRLHTSVTAHAHIQTLPRRSMSSL